MGYLEQSEQPHIPFKYLGDDNAPVPADAWLFLTVGGIGCGIRSLTRLFGIHRAGLTNLIFRDASVSHYAHIVPDAGISVYAKAVIRSNVVVSANTCVNSLCNLGYDV